MELKWTSKALADLVGPYPRPSLVAADAVLQTAGIAPVKADHHLGED